jgi:hypothetical protein
VALLFLEREKSYVEELLCDVGEITEEGFNPLNTELNPIRHLLALVKAHHFVHVSRIRFKEVTAKGN